jgi:hypothetical protein
LRLLGALVLALLAAALTPGCSFIVENDGPLACSQERQLGPPACDPGQVCRSGTCQAPAKIVGGASPEGGCSGAPDCALAGWTAGGSP